MTSSPALAALTGALIITGLIVIGAALTGTELLPAPPAGRPHRRPIRWRTRRTLAETVAVITATLGVWALTGWPVAGIAVAAAIIAVPRLLGGRTAQQRIARLEALEAWTRQLTDVLTTGTSIEDALLTTAKDPPPAIADQVTALRRRLEYRVATEDAIRAFAEELAHPIAETVAAAMIVASRLRGRGLHEVLTALAKTVAQDVAMQRQIDAERATHRTTALWVVAALAAFVGFAVINRTYVAPFSTATGQMMLVLIAALYAGVIWWLHRLTTPPPGPRFLNGGKNHR